MTPGPGFLGLLREKAHLDEAKSRGFSPFTEPSGKQWAYLYDIQDRHRMDLNNFAAEVWRLTGKVATELTRDEMTTLIDHLENAEREWEAMVPERMSLMGTVPCTYTSEQKVRMAAGGTRGLGDSPPRPVMYEPLRGEEVPQARLTEDKVREIRRRYDAGGETMTALGAAFGVARSTVWQVGHRSSWAHVPEEVA